MNKKILFKSSRNTTIAAIYIFLVSQLMQNSDTIFGINPNAFLAPFMVLLLFSFSAAVVGGLIFGDSVIQLLAGKKRDGILSAIYSIGWLGIYTLLGIILIILI